MNHKRKKVIKDFRKVRKNEIIRRLVIRRKQILKGPEQPPEFDDVLHGFKKMNASDIYINIDNFDGDQHGEIIILGKPENEENHDCEFIGCPLGSHIIFRAYCTMIFE